jgi:ubiquinone/menaquinone biosynthesis C-methylase UbiE
MAEQFSKYLTHQRAPKILLRFPNLLHFYYWINRLTVLRTWYVRRTLRNILASTPAPRNILDAGCGMGDFIFSIPEIHHHDTVTGIDISYSNFQLCERFAETMTKHNCTFVHGSLSESPIPKNQDIILCIAVLMYIKDDVSVLRKFKEALAETGRLILYVPVNYRRHLRLYRTLSTKPGFDYDETIGRPHTYTDELIRERLMEAGLHIEHQYHSFGKISAIMFEISSIFEWFFKKQNPLLFIPLSLIYLVFFPFNLLAMALDYFGERTTGNGCIIVAKKT